MSRRPRAGRRSARADTEGRVVAGIGPVRELLRGGAGAVKRLWLVDATGARAELAGLAEAAGVPVSHAALAELDERAGEGQLHQGAVAEAHPYRYRDTDDMLALARARGEEPLLVALDSVTDPHNLGAIARSAYLLGAHGLVIPRDRAAQVSTVVTKASAGAVDHLAIAQVTNLARALAELKEQGLWTYAVASGPGAQPLARVDARGPVCLVMGSEGSGIRPLVARQCDVSVEIPMRGEAVGSFNVSVAAAIALYEIDRQRRTPSEP